MIKIKWAVIFFIIGIAGGIFLGYPLFHKDPVISSVKEKTEVTNTEKITGIPDTNTVIKKQESKLKIKNAGETNFDIDKNKAGITKVTVAKSDSDSTNLHIEYQYPEKTIVRVDTVKTEKTITLKETNTEVITKMPDYLLGAGVKVFYENMSLKTMPFVHLTANTKLWFLYLSVEGRAVIDNQNLQLKIKPEIEGKLSVQL